MTRGRPIAVSIGCPCGIGPEVAVRAAARASSPCVLIGDLPLLTRVAARHRLSARLVVVDDLRALGRLSTGEVGVWRASTPLLRAPTAGRPTRSDGAAQLAWIDEATDLVQSGAASALATAPVSKAAIARSGAGPIARRFRGHTEHIAERTGAEEVVMAFWSDKLATSLVTTHVPLARVARAVTPERVATSTYWLVRLLAQLGHRRPRVVVGGVNPHAGEDGHLGREEIRAVTPGVELARRRLARERRAAVVSGPMGAESAYRHAAAGAFEGVVAMYHDQATIAMKLVGFGESVNVTLGLPIVRTSVDHGTAYDLAATGRADPAGMEGALALAARLAGGVRSLRTAAMTKRSRERDPMR